MYAKVERMALTFHVLLIEDDSLVIEAVKTTLPDDCTFEVFESLMDYLKLSEGSEAKFDLALVDLMSPGDPLGEKALAHLSVLRQQLSNTTLVVQSGSQEIEHMRKALSAGVHRFLAKEKLVEELPELLRWAGAQNSVAQRIDSLIVGQSSPVLQLKSRLLQMLLHNFDVLVQGESGSGKELCAQAFSLQGHKFEAINVNAIQPELFESAFFGHEKGAFTGAHKSQEGLLELVGDGVLFLDEIQSLSLDLQVKLLRVLETRRFRRVGADNETLFQGRIIAASNRRLADLVEKGQFRDDLFYRLSSLTLNVPPLRDRREDIPLLLSSLTQAMEISPQEYLPEAIETLQNYDWPGNVRQLKTCIRNLAIKYPIPKVGADEVRNELQEWESGELGSLSGSEEESFSVDWEKSFDENLLSLEKHLLVASIEKFGSVQAMERLQLKKSRFYDKLKNLKLR